MGEPQVQTGFDERERARVRRALRHYMAEHRIGTPTLQARIIEGDAPRHREIPLSTLQRFIVGSHHTHDHHVALCHAFVRELPYYGEGRDIEQFGEALFGFLQGPVHGSERETLTARLGSEFAGAYESDDGSLTLTALDRQPYLHAREISPRFVAREEASERDDEFLRCRRAREGVMVLLSPCLYMIMRDSLTRQPKLCSLRQRVVSSEGQDMKVLEGQTFQPGFMDGMAPIQQTVRFVPAAAREDT